MYRMNYQNRFDVSVRVFILPSVAALMVYVWCNRSVEFNKPNIHMCKVRSLSFICLHVVLVI